MVSSSPDHGWIIGLCRLYALHCIEGVRMLIDEDQKSIVEWPNKELVEGGQDREHMRPIHPSIATIDLLNSILIGTNGSLVFRLNRCFLDSLHQRTAQSICFSTTSYEENIPEPRSIAR